MSRDKQIEEMEIALREAFKAYDNAWHECFQNKSRQPDREPVFYAKYLVEKKGYRKASEVVREIFEEIERCINLHQLGYGDAEYVRKVILYFKEKYTEGEG